MAVLAETRITLEEFLADPRIDERAEYLRGEVHEPRPESFFHLRTARFLESALAQVFGIDHSIRVADLPLADARPRPDVVVLRHEFGAYVPPEGYEAGDVELVVEVCLSSASRDYEIKDTLYAAAGIPQYWIVDLDRDRIERRTEPTPLGYAKHEVFFRGSDLMGIEVDRILGEPSRGDAASSSGL